MGPLPEPAELRLAHRALEPQQQPIVELAGVVDPFRVDDQRVQQATQIEQLIPVVVVARQARDLEAHDGPDGRLRRGGQIRAGGQTDAQPVFDIISGLIYFRIGVNSGGLLPKNTPGGYMSPLRPRRRPHRFGFVSRCGRG